MVKSHCFSFRTTTFAGVQIFPIFTIIFFSAREFAGLNKQMPTCAGLPMNMTVRVNVVDFLKVDLSADVSEYLKKTGPVTANWGLSIV